MKSQLTKVKLVSKLFSQFIPISKKWFQSANTRPEI